MTVFIDTNVIVYSGVESDRREACAEILRAIARGVVDGRTSTAVLEEVWHLELSRKAGVIEGLTERTYKTFSPLLPITDEIFRDALSIEATRLGANDRIHVATALANGIGTVVSSDATFDGVRGLRRIDPLDEAARRRLIADVT